MKITKRMLSIPPHVSTSWKNVAALRVEEDFEGDGPALLVQLQDGLEIRVPRLLPGEIEAVFEAHAQYLERVSDEEEAAQLGHQAPGFQGFGEQMAGLPFRLGPAGIESLGAAMMHDSNQRGAPDLPSEILAKVGQIAQMLGAEAAAELPEPEVGCNCFHCQIAGAIQRGMGDHDEEEHDEEEVSDEELSFRTWDIRQVGEKLFIVADPLDNRAHYSVFLGQPVGCTCGEAHCEHIQAVLRS